MEWKNWWKNCWLPTSLLVPVLIFLNVASILSLFWVAVGTMADGSPCLSVHDKYDWEQHMNAIVVMSWALPTTWLAYMATTLHMRRTTTFCLLNWVAALSGLMGQASEDCSSNAFLQSVGPVARVIEVITGLIATIAGMDLATSRVECLEDHALQSFGAWITRWSLRGLVIMVVFAMVMLSFLVHFDEAWAGSFLLGLVCFSGLLVLSWLCGAATTTCRLLNVTRNAGEGAPDWMVAWTQRADRALRFEVKLLVATLSTTFVRIVLGTIRTNHKNDDDVLWWPLLVAFLVDHACNLVSAMLLSGALTRSRQSVARARLRRQRRSAARQRWRKRPAEMAEWDRKVRELAGRGISLEVLLDFYRDLPTMMEHYEPGRHTTADVVGQALIPLSSKQRCPAVEILMGGACTRPEKMVTHAWGNVFRDLVAAVVADAFGEGEYDLYAQLLTKDVSHLQGWVQRAGLGRRTYWICAFAVNQHLGICEANGKKKDSVTGLPCPPCECGLPKAWSSTPPLLSSGLSIPCEMNKFDDMMRLLSAEDPNFAQVVAIDAKFMTFSRAWCIAEVAAASEMGMMQGIKMSSAADLERHKEALRGLKIKEMEASRPEDKEMILAGISDHAAFDASLQRLIFEDLLPSWSSLDAEERMAAAGRVIKWQSKAVLEKLA